MTVSARICIGACDSSVAGQGEVFNSANEIDVDGLCDVGVQNKVLNG